MIKKAKEKEYAGDAGAGCACRYGYTKPDDYPSCMYDEETCRVSICLKTG